MGVPELLILPQAPPLNQLPPDLHDAQARYRVEIEDGRSFLLTIDHGRLSLKEDGGEGDGVLKCSMDVFHRVLSGDVNLLTAFIRGDVRMSGDLRAIKALYRFLRLCRTQRNPL